MYVHVYMKLEACLITKTIPNIQLLLLCHKVKYPLQQVSRLFIISQYEGTTSGYKQAPQYIYTDILRHHA